MTLWKRRSVLVFFAVGFGVPWIGWTVLAVTGLGTEGPRGSALTTALFYTGDFMTVGGLVATFVGAGVIGFRSLLKRCLSIWAPPHWIFFALFLPLGWELLLRAIWGLTHGGIGRVDPAGLLIYFAPGVLLAFTTGPLGEEAGWRGFLLPRLIARYSPLTASLILGGIWSLWHYPLYWNGVFGTPRGGLLFTISVLCFSVLLTVLWAYTKASVFWAIILHWTINISSRVASGLLPDVDIPEDPASWLRAAVLVSVTIGVVLTVRPSRLATKLGEVMPLLDNEDDWSRTNGEVTTRQR